MWYFERYKGTCLISLGCISKKEMNGDPAVPNKTHCENIRNCDTDSIMSSKALLFLPCITVLLTVTCSHRKLYCICSGDTLWGEGEL